MTLIRRIFYQTSQLKNVSLKSYGTNRSNFLVINSIRNVDSKRFLSTLSELTQKAESLVKSKPIIKEPVIITSSSKQRIIKKKLKKNTPKPYFDTFKVKSYSTADYYNLTSLKRGLIDSGAYEVIELQTDLPDNCILVKPKYPELNEHEPRHVFFFEEGTVVFWNTSNEEQNSLLELLLKHSEMFYTQEVINEESEYLSYSTINSNETKEQVTRLDKNHIFFKQYQLGDFNEIEAHLLEKYAFSDAISLSVQLGSVIRDDLIRVYLLIKNVFLFLLKAFGRLN